MAKEITRLIYTPENRQKMRKHPSYKNFEAVWEKEDFGKEENVGALGYLIKDIHERMKKNNNQMLTRKEWGEAYLKSGEERENAIKANPYNAIPSALYKLNIYKGRTLENLYELSQNYGKACIKKYGLNLSSQAAFNIVFIKVFDETYESYQRQMNAILNLKSKEPQLTFILANALSFEHNAVDIFAYDNKNNLVGAFQVIPNNAEIKDESMSESGQKHDFFESIYGIHPQILRTTTSGIINEEDFPRFA